MFDTPSFPAFTIQGKSETSLFFLIFHYKIKRCEEDSTTPFPVLIPA